MPGEGKAPLGTVERQNQAEEFLDGLTRGAQTEALSLLVPKLGTQTWQWRLRVHSQGLASRLLASQGPSLS
jgi:hypothetical protein